MGLTCLENAIALLYSACSPTPGTALYRQKEKGKGDPEVKGQWEGHNGGMVLQESCSFEEFSPRSISPLRKKEKQLHLNPFHDALLFTWLPPTGNCKAKMFLLKSGLGEDEGEEMSAFWVPVETENPKVSKKKMYLEGNEQSELGLAGCSIRAELATHLSLLTLHSKQLPQECQMRWRDTLDPICWKWRSFRAGSVT